MRIAAAVLGVVVAAGTACGGNGNGDRTAAGSAIEPEAQKRAESVVLTLSDFPTGWRASAPEEEEGGEELRKCIGIDYSGLTRIGDADSKDFAMGESTEASSQASVFENERQAEDWMKEYSKGMNSNTVEDCFQDIVEANVRKESTGKDTFKLGDVDVGQLSFTSPDVDEAAAWQVVIPVEVTEGIGKGLSPSVYVEFVILREGDTVASVETQDVLTEFDPELRGKLVQAVAGRMSDSSNY